MSSWAQPKRRALARIRTRYWIVELDPALENKHMIVRGGGDLIMQLAFDNGKKDGFTEVTVLPAH